MAIVPSIEPPAPRPPAGLGDAAPPSSQSVDLPTAPLQQPTAAQAQDFAQAIAAAPIDVQPARSATDSNLMQHIAQQADAFTKHFKLPAETSAIPVSGHGDAAAMAGQPQDFASAAVKQMEHAYMVAIETTMASRGSTESTKIFNTLLKGQ